MIMLRNCFLSLLFIFAAGFCGCTVDDDPGGGDPDPRDKYLGSWQVSDQPARLNYEVSIQNNPSNSTEVLLQNFADLGGSAIGLVVGNSIIIDKQSIGGNFQVEGTGSYIKSTELSFTYELDDGIDVENRTAVFSK